MNIGGNNLTHANYGNISSEIKLIDSLKFYQRSFGELSSTLTNIEKNAIKNVTEKFWINTIIFVPFGHIWVIKKKIKF